MTDGRGRTLGAVRTPQLIEILHDHPAVRESFPVADAIDTAIRWNV